MKHLVTALIVAATVSLAVDAKDSPLAPLSIARQGYFFVGGKYSTVKDQQVMSGQLYVEFQIPSKQMHDWPIVMVHGGGQSGTNFTGTPDGVALEDGRFLAPGDLLEAEIEGIGVLRNTVGKPI